MRLLRRRCGSADDRELVRLAVPALGALAAGPLYTLADTAIVGHLGTRQLAALALASTIVAAITQLSDFLSYTTTAQVARLHGAGREREAGGVAAQALWLSLTTGVVIGIALAALSSPAARALDGSGAGVAALTARYVALSAIGLPGMLIALAGEGFLRGISDLRTPLRILVACNAANVVLEVGLVYGLHLGLDGSAVGTVVAQLAMGILFARHMLAAPADRRRPALARIRPLVRMGAHLTVRSAALLGAFLLASALAARIGAASLGAHQIAFELYIFLALVLDAIAIAGQIIIARRLGSGDGAGARQAARRMIGWALAVGLLFALVLLAGTDLIPRAFSSDPAVWGRAASAWPLFALMQPVAAVVFALDGILIGAGDSRYLAGAMVVSLAVFVPVALAASSLAGLWIALDVLMLARLLTLAGRFARGRWAVLGAPGVAEAAAGSGGA
ncbi:MAG TPA: MATE family efflux transporter [Solirubrobacteraceae bacterium]|nr:MATE family efflux transporter [Solirubrobacteraceae bacterium]